MAWNPEPRVADCRDIARKWGGKKQIIIIAIDDQGVMDIATYGETRQLCTVARELGKQALEGVQRYIEMIDAMLERGRAQN